LISNTGWPITSGERMYSAIRICSPVGNRLAIVSTWLDGRNREMNILRKYLLWFTLQTRGEIIFISSHRPQWKEVIISGSRIFISNIYGSQTRNISSLPSGSILTSTILGLSGKPLIQNSTLIMEHQDQPVWPWGLTWNYKMNDYEQQN